MFSDADRLREAARARRAQAFRPGTRANHRSHALLFVAFSLHFEFQDFPVRPQGLVCFGEFLLRSYSSPKSVLNVFSSVRRLHFLRGFTTEAFEDPQVFLWKRALPLTLRHLPIVAPPFPLQLLQRACVLADSLGARGRVFAALLAVTFYTMARLSSLVPVSLHTFDRTRLPTLADVREDGSSRSFHLKWAKNCQQTTQGYWVPLLACPGSGACPVARLDALRGLLEGAPGSTPLFSFPGEGTGAHPRKRGGFTIALAREWLRCLLCALGVRDKAFTFHSLRRGACTLAFRQGAAFTDLQQLGGWRSEAVRGYFSGMDARRRAARCLVSRAGTPTHPQAK